MCIFLIEMCPNFNNKRPFVLLFCVNIGLFDTESTSINFLRIFLHFKCHSLNNSNDPNLKIFLYHEVNSLKNHPIKKLTI